MNHLAFSFDPSWFLTVPGLLITGGVLLLIIALVIFIVTSGKGNKKEKAKKVDMVLEEEKPVTMEDTSVSLDVPEKTEVEEKKPFIQIPEEDEDTEPSLESNPVSKEEEVVPSIMPEAQPVDPIDTNTKVNDLASFDPFPEVTFESHDEPDVEKTEEAPFVSPIPTVSDSGVENKDKVSIYGGVSPTIPPIMEEKKESHQIYGGANPLDATQSIPIVQENHGYASSLKETVSSAQNNRFDDLANFRPIADDDASNEKEELNKKDDVEMLDF